MDALLEAIDARTAYRATSLLSSAQSGDTDLEMQIGEIVGISQMHVSRLLRRALDRLRTRARGEMRTELDG